MNKLIPILTLFFISFSASGQNWNPLKPVSRNYFTNVHGYLKAINIDSVVAVGNDLHYYPNRRLKLDPWGGDAFFGPDTMGSWLGQCIIRNTNGDFLFVNHWADTILIRSKASPGNSWIFYQHGSRYYTAEVSTVDTMSIFGITDSVKRILLHAYENGVLLPNDSFDGAEIVLSKEHGFQTTMELYFFPFHEPDTNLVVEDYFFTRSLYPMSDYSSYSAIPGKYACRFSLVSFPDPSPSDFMQLNVGDVTQYSACQVSIMLGVNTCMPPYTHRLDTVIAKHVNSYGTEYVRRGWKAGQVYLGDTPSYYNIWTFQDTLFVADTGKYFTAYNDTFGFALPEQIMPYYYFLRGWHSYYFPSDTSFCFGSPAYFKRAFNYGGLDSEMQFYGHKQGIGFSTSYSSAYHNGLTVNGHHVINYAVRNGVACGNYVFPDTTRPVNVSLVSSEEDAFKVYPNPASDELRVEANTSSYELSLLNSVGQLVLMKQGCRKQELLDLQAYPDGVYILRISAGGGNSAFKKVLIQH